MSNKVKKDTKVNGSMQKKKDIKLDFEKIKIKRRWLGVDTKGQWRKKKKKKTMKELIISSPKL